MQQAVRDAGPDDFGENGGIYVSSSNVVLFGQMDSGEEPYWRNLVFDTGSRTISDPYQLIDGGHQPGESYQLCCTAQPWKAAATAALLMPELRELWSHEPFFDYVVRWVGHGAWTQPDTCAPATGTCAGGDNPGAACTFASAPVVCTGEGAACDGSTRWDSDYGVVYGPNGSGACLPDTDASDGTGRFPQLHGSNADQGHYGSAFASALWQRELAPNLP